MNLECGPEEASDRKPPAPDVILDMILAGENEAL
jgi:hypothetical protein